MRFATAQAAQGCSFSGTNGAWAGWSGGKKKVPFERTSNPSTWPNAPPTRSGARAARTRIRKSRRAVIGEILSRPRSGSSNSQKSYEICALTYTGATSCPDESLPLGAAFVNW